MFGFMKDLAANNERAWFAENKERYEFTVREPALDFIESFRPHLHAISKHFVADARPVGGSLFRLHRDTRFAADKSPYKTHTGLHFRHERAKDAHAPGFYLHLEPGQVFAGAGIWHPDGETLRKIRDAIVDDPAAWKRARGGTFAKTFTLGGDSLKRPPAGYDPAHPMIEDLKRKDFIGIVTLTQKDATAAGFVERFASLCRDASPLMKFLCRSIGIAF